MATHNSLLLPLRVLIHLPGASHLRANSPTTRTTRSRAPDPDASAMIRDSKWITRAWTYHEALLSKRNLTITDYHVYFECPNMHRYEAVNSQPCKWVVGIQYATSSCRRSTLFTFEDVIPSSLGAWKLIVHYTNRWVIGKTSWMESLVYFVSSKTWISSFIFIGKFQFQANHLHPLHVWPISVSDSIESYRKEVKRIPRGIKEVGDSWFKKENH